MLLFRDKNSKIILNWLFGSKMMKDLKIDLSYYNNMVKLSTL